MSFLRIDLELAIASSLCSFGLYRARDPARESSASVRSAAELRISIFERLGRRLVQVSLEAECFKLAIRSKQP